MSKLQQDMKLLFTDADVLDMLSVINDFLKETSRLLNANNNEPAVNSIAAKEKENFPNRESVESVHYGGFLSMEIAADHLMAFADCLSEPAETIAPWTCVRGLLESCSLASWFLDPSIDVKTRVGRYFAFRYTGFIQQIKLYNVQGKGQEGVKRVEDRIRKVEHDALKLGYSRILNKDGNIDGIGQKMPDITSLIGITLNREAEYRLLSAIAHGHHWATHQIGFSITEFTDSEGSPKKGLKKALNPDLVLYVASIAITSFAQVLWYAWRLYGWNEDDIKTLFDNTYDKLNFMKQPRFWRK